MVKSLAAPSDDEKKNEFKEKKCVCCKFGDTNLKPVEAAGKIIILCPFCSIHFRRYEIVKADPRFVSDIEFMGAFQNFSDDVDQYFCNIHHRFLHLKYIYGRPSKLKVGGEPKLSVLESIVGKMEIVSAFVNAYHDTWDVTGIRESLGNKNMAVAWSLWINAQESTDWFEGGVRHLFNALKHGEVYDLNRNQIDTDCEGILDLRRAVEKVDDALTEIHREKYRNSPEGKAMAERQKAVWGDLIRD